MRTRLKAIGDETGLILDRPLLEAAKLGPDAEVEIETQGDTLIVRPVRDKHNPVTEAFQRVVEHPKENHRMPTDGSPSEPDLSEGTPGGQRP